MFQQESINVPVLGIVENMAYFTPDELPDKKYHLFGVSVKMKHFRPGPFCAKRIPVQKAAVLSPGRRFFGHERMFEHLQYVIYKNKVQIVLNFLR